MRQALESRFEPLRLLGWESIERDQAGVVVVVVGDSGDNSGDFFPSFRFPLTEPIRVKSEETPLAWLSLTVDKRSARVNLEVAFEAWARLFRVVRPYLQARSARLSEIAGSGTWGLDSPAIPILWEEKGGWGDDIDWPSRIAELGERTSQWLEALADLRPRLVNELAEDV